VEARTFHEATLSARPARRNRRRFGISASAALVNAVRNALNCLWRPARHVQQLSELQVDERMAFCCKMLGMSESLGWICFSGERRVAHGSDGRWVWSRRGEGNLSACIETQKLAHSLMVVAVSGPAFNSGFLKKLDALYGPFEWIFRPDKSLAH
jgi:hypothetical protein